MLSFLIGLLIVVVGAAGAFAMQGTPDATPAGDGPLPPLVWQLTEAALADGTVHVPDDPSRYTIQFLADGQVSARADCNQVGGSYEVDGVGLTLSNLTTTLVGCPEGSLGSEYGSWLESVAGFELTDDALVLSLDDGSTLRFAPALVGVVWEWQQFISSNNAVVAPEEPEQYTLQFQADGSVLVQADCNRGGGSYVTDGPTIAIERIGLTRMACPADSLANEFVTHLEEVSSFVFTEGELSLALPMDGGFLLFTAAAAVAPPTTPVAATPSSG
jgi:heat shock protein HslJ